MNKVMSGQPNWHSLTPNIPQGSKDIERVSYEC